MPINRRNFTYSFMARDDVFKEFSALCTANNFLRKGKSFYRIVGDGVLQVLKIEQDSIRHPPFFSLGLFSMYGELQKQWFTSSGSITRYPVSVFDAIDDVNISFDESQYSLQHQLDILTNKGMSWLNQIDTQAKLSVCMRKLDIACYNTVIWNDLEKFAPHLHSGDTVVAIKIIDAILAQYRNTEVTNSNDVIDDECQYAALKLEPEDIELHQKKILVQSGDMDKIKEYLNRNFAQNCMYAKFCLPERRNINGNSFMW